jgi:DNA-binding transcriptional MerR regulator
LNLRKSLVFVEMLIFRHKIYAIPQQKAGMSALTPSQSPLYRIGAVSKATAIPVSTLRIWQTRYGAFSPVKTEGNQRLFAEQDVSKALLLKQLSDAGHGIGSIAHLPLPALRELCHAQHPANPQPSPAQPVCLAVVGVGLANRLESRAFADVLSRHRIQVTDVLQDLETACLTPMTDKPQVLLVKVNSLQDSVFESIRVLMQQHPFAQTIVLYHFAPDVVVQAMKIAGLIVRRDPISDTELAELLQSILFVDRDRAQAFGHQGAVIASRKYSDLTLRRVAGISTNVLCECPKHVAELIAQLASFEEYSQECLNKNTEDAHLHSYLRSISGSARSLFENALEKIAAHEGIDLRESPRPSQTP